MKTHFLNKSIFGAIAAYLVYLVANDAFNRRNRSRSTYRAGRAP